MPDAANRRNKNLIDAGKSKLRLGTLTRESPGLILARQAACLVFNGDRLFLSVFKLREFRED